MRQRAYRRIRKGYRDERQTDKPHKFQNKQSSNKQLPNFVQLAAAKLTTIINKNNLLSSKEISSSSALINNR